MPQPTAYTRQYNFTDFQSSSPSDPLPATQVDGELNQVKTNLDGINTNIALLQRDDGKLANNSVGTQQFGVDALTLIGASGSGFNIRGVWGATTAYAIGDIVESSQATYYCITAHTSGNAFADNSSKFVLIANAAIQTTATNVEKFTGNGSTVAFSLASTYGSDKDVQVYVNGSLKTPQSESNALDASSYTISGNTLTFVTAPPTNSYPNVFVWGTSVAVEAAKATAVQAKDDALGYRNTTNDHRLTAESYAVQSASAVVQTFSGGSGTNISPAVYSAKTYAGDTTGSADTHGGSAKGWAQTAEDTAVPGASSTDRSAKHYMLKAEDFKDQAEASAQAASGHNISISQVAALAVALG